MVRSHGVFETKTYVKAFHALPDGTILHVVLLGVLEAEFEVPDPTTGSDTAATHQRGRRELTPVNSGVDPSQPPGKAFL